MTDNNLERANVIIDTLINQRNSAMNQNANLTADIVILNDMIKQYEIEMEKLGKELKEYRNAEQIDTPEDDDA